MRRKSGTLAIAAVAGCCLAAFQVVRENHDRWDAAHATLPTIIIQTSAGAVIGGAFVAALMFYFLLRRSPARQVAGAPPQVALEWAPVSVRPSQAGPARAQTSTTRRVFILLFAACLLAGGGIVLLACLEHPTVYSVLRGGFGAAFLIALGGYLIWDDFVAPLIGGATRGKSPLG